MASPDKNEFVTRDQALAEVERLRAENQDLKQRGQADVVKLPVSEDLFRIPLDPSAPRERPDNVPQPHRPNKPVTDADAMAYAATAGALKE